MLIVPAVVLILACAIFLLAILRLPGRVAALLGLYLLCYANIVLVGEITNSVLQLNNPWLWLGLHLPGGRGLAGLAARRAARSVERVASCDSAASELWTALKRWPDLSLLAVGVGLWFLFNAY